MLALYKVRETAYECNNHISAEPQNRLSLLISVVLRLL